jgi:hypothetical protein
LNILKRHNATKTTCKYARAFGGTKLSNHTEGEHPERLLCVLLGTHEVSEAFQPQMPDLSSSWELISLFKPSLLQAARYYFNPFFC